MLKTLISDISLAPESAINYELDEQSYNDINDSPTIGDLADQKPQLNRTVVSVCIIS